MKRALSGVLALALGSMIATTASALDRSGSVQVGNTARTYLVHVPDSRPPAGGFPVVLAFHGGGSAGVRFRRLTGLDRLADARGFIAVYPNGVDGHWNDGRSTIRNPQDDVGFVAALLDQVAAGTPVDQRRIYATGLSNGALFAERLGCDLSDRIAAIAPVAGSLPADLSCSPRRRVAVLQINGTADPIMPFEGGPVADFGGHGEGGQVLSVAATARFWAQRDGCGEPGAGETLPPLAPLDPTRIIRTRYPGCAAANSVTTLTVLGGGHAWPGAPQYAPAMLIGRVSGQLRASTTIADFFLSLPPR